MNSKDEPAEARIIRYRERASELRRLAEQIRSDQSAIDSLNSLADQFDQLAASMKSGRRW